MILSKFLTEIDTFNDNLNKYIPDVLNNNQWVVRGSTLDRFLEEEVSENKELGQYIKEWLPLRLNFIKSCFKESLHSSSELKIARRLVINNNQLEHFQTLINKGKLTTTESGLHFAEYGLECAWNYYGEYDNMVEVNICIDLTPENINLVDFNTTICNRIDWENGDDEQEITLEGDKSLKGAYLEVIKYH